MCSGQDDVCVIAVGVVGRAYLKIAANRSRNVLFTVHKAVTCVCSIRSRSEHASLLPVLRFLLALLSTKARTPPPRRDLIIRAIT